MTIVQPYQPPSGGTPAPTTPAPTGTTPPVAGPNAAGLNPGVSGVPATSLDPAIANKPLPGGGTVGVTATRRVGNANQIKAQQAAQKYALLLEAYANLFSNFTPQGNGPNSVPYASAGTKELTQQQLDALKALKIPGWNDTLWSGIDTSNQNVAPFYLSNDNANKIFANLKAATAKAIAKAIPGLDAATLLAHDPSDALDQPLPQQLVHEFATYGFTMTAGDTIGNALAAVDPTGRIAKAQTVTDRTGGSAQTAGDAYQTFIKELSDPKTGKTFAGAQVPALEAAGLLDKNAAGTAQTNGTKYTDTQIASAYQQVLNQQVTNNQTEAQALESLASNTAAPGGPTSEMAAYVQGVATEFGVGLTQQQVTAIANTYGANAQVADVPSSVEDEIKDAVVALYDPTAANNPPGVADTMYTNIQQAALSYQIPITAQQIGQMVKTALQGATVESMYVAANAAEAAATKQFQTQAQGLYPALSDQIQAGNTVQNLVAPYFNVAEAYTGVPAATMMADQQTGGPSKWAAFLQGGQNPSGSTKTAPGMTASTGGPQMMTLDEWKKELMQNPTYGFQNTQGGKDMAEQLTSAILNEFGKVSTVSGSPFNQYSPSSDLSANTS